MSDPLDAAAADAVSDAQALVTADYVPLLIGAVLFGIVLRFAFRWFGRAVREIGGGGMGADDYERWRDQGGY